MTSQEFKEARLRLGLRQRVLGRLMGLETIQAVSRIERGERRPTKIQAAFLRYIEAHPPTAAEIEAADQAARAPASPE